MSQNFGSLSENKPSMICPAQDGNGVVYIIDITSIGGGDKEIFVTKSFEVNNKVKRHMKIYFFMYVL